MSILLLFPNQVGSVLRQKRNAMGITQQQLARRLCLAQSRISFLESHPEAISLVQLLAWMHVLGLDLQCAQKPESEPEAGEDAW